MSNESNESTPHICMDPGAKFWGGNAWERAFMGPRLDDRAIRRYERAGFYSPEARAARKTLRELRAAKRRAAQQRRENAPANFFFGDDGRLIYSPV